jgi:hypothetical protein
LGPRYDQGPLAFLKELLLLSGVLKALILWILKLRTVYRITQVHTSKEVQQRTVYRITQVHTSKQVQQIRNSTPNSVNRTKQGYKAIVHVARIA